MFTIYCFLKASYEMTGIYGHLGSSENSLQVPFFIAYPFFSALRWDDLILSN